VATCYAQVFGDCNGAIEDEHFLPQSLQRMFGSVVIAGMAWQHGESSRSLPAGTYAHSRILCQKHHDDLDGLDGNAAAYFKNLMFMAGGQHLASGAVGRATDITPVIDGRALERWFLKLMCGAVVTGSIEQRGRPRRSGSLRSLKGSHGRSNGPCISRQAIGVSSGATGH